jgi:hypothetical protein
MARIIGGHAFLYHNATPEGPEKGPDLTKGTSLERIAAESLTRRLLSFVHGDMWFTLRRETTTSGNQAPLFVSKTGPIVNGSASRVILKSQSRTYPPLWISLCINGRVRPGRKRWAKGATASSARSMPWHAPAP